MNGKNGKDVRAVGTAGSADVSEAVQEVMSRWQGPVDIIQADSKAAPQSNRYGTVFVAVFDGRVAVSWCTGDEHTFDAQTGMCIESSDGRMKGWRIVPWEMHRFNAKDAEAYVKACGVSMSSASSGGLGKHAYWTTDATGKAGWPGRNGIVPVASSASSVAADTADELSAHAVAEELFRAGVGRNDARVAGVKVTVDGDELAAAVAESARKQTPIGFAPDYVAKLAEDNPPKASTPVLGHTLILLSDIFTKDEVQAAATEMARLDGLPYDAWNDMRAHIQRVGDSVALGARVDRIIFTDDALKWIGKDESLDKWLHSQIVPRKTFNCTTTFVSMNAVISALRGRIIARNTSTRPSDSSPPPSARATDNLQQ